MNSALLTRVFENESEKEWLVLIDRLAKKDSNVFMSRYIDALEVQGRFDMALYLLDQVGNDSAQEPSFLLERVRLSHILTLRACESIDELEKRTKERGNSLTNDSTELKLVVDSFPLAFSKADPFQAYKLVEKIIHAILAKTPFALMKIHTEDEELKKSGNKKPDFARLYSFDFLNDNKEGTVAYSEHYEDVIAKADLLGVPVDSLMDHGKTSMTVNSEVIVSAEINRDLHSWGLYEFLMSFVDRCHVISKGNRLSDILFRKFNLFKV